MERKEHYKNRSVDDLIAEILLLKEQLNLAKKKSKKNLIVEYPGLSLIKKYELVLNESEEKYRFLFSKANDAIFIIYKSIITDCNEKSEFIFGKTREELLGKSIYSFFPSIQPDNSNSIDQANIYVKNALKGESQNFYWKLIKEDGNEFDTEVNLSVILTDKKKFIQIIVKDITEELNFEKQRKEAEQILRKQNEVLLSLANNINIYSGNIGEAYKDITKIASENLNVERVSIWLSDENITKINQVCLYNKSTGIFTEEHLELCVKDYPEYFESIKKERVLVASDVINDSRTKKFNESYNIPLNINSLLDVPFRLEGKIKGIICFEQLRTKREWSIEEQNFAGAMADVIVLTLEAAERIKVERELKKSEEKFRLLSESSPIGIFLSDENGKPVYFNEKILQITGHNENIFLSNQWFQIIHPIDFSKVAKNILRAVNDKTNYSEEFRVKREDGEIVWVRFNSNIIIGKDNEYVGWVGTIEDISEQRNFMQRLKESEKRFRLLSETAIEGIMFSENNIIIDVNDRFIFMHGYTSRDEVIGRNVKDFLVPEENENILSKLQSKNTLTHEIRTKKKDGTFITVELKGEEIPYYGKKIKASVLNDISERKKFINAIKESERTLSNLMNNLPGMAYRCSNPENWQADFISEGCYQLTGYMPYDFIQNDFKLYSSLVNPNDISEVWNNINKSLKTKQPFEVEYRIKDNQGKEKWVWEKGMGVYADDGKLLYLEGFITDITLRKEYDKLIRQSRESYKNLVEKSPVGVIIHENDKILYANLNALNAFGLRTDELDKNSIWSFILPEYHNVIKERINNLKTGKDIEFNEIKVVKKTGEILDIETSGSIIDFYGKEAVQTVFYDISYRRALQREQLRAQIAEETNKKFQKEITERIKAQKKLIEIQKFTRSIISSSLDMICATDNKNKIIEYNEAAQKKFGYTQKELEGISPGILYANNEEYLMVERILKEKGNFTGEVVNRRKSGECFTSFLSASLLKNEDGEIMGSMGVSRDITEQKNTEQKIYEQASKLKSFFESNSHSFWTINKNLELTSFNQKYSEINFELYGFYPEKNKSLLSIDKIILETRDFWKEKYRVALKGKAQKFEIEQIGKTGETKIREVFLNPIYDADNNVIEIAAIAQDVTQQKLDQKRIKNSLNEKEVLLKEVHHRVKNNLQVISSILNLQSSFVKEESTLNILRESQNRIKAMAFIHESLYQTKDFSKINFSEYILNLSKNLVHSYGLFSGLIDLEIDADDVYLNLDFAIPAGLIVNELVSNSLKYAFPNGKKGVIKIVIKKNKEVITLSQEDNGIGIPENIDIKNTETLGLQLVTALVEQISGKLEFSTQKNRGTIFSIVFNRKP